MTAPRHNLRVLHWMTRDPGTVVGDPEDGRVRVVWDDAPEVWEWTEVAHLELPDETGEHA